MIANKAGLSLLYDTLDELVESGEMTEEEARSEWRDIISEQNNCPEYYDPSAWE